MINAKGLFTIGAAVFSHLFRPPSARVLPELSVFLHCGTVWISTCSFGGVPELPELGSDSTQPGVEPDAEYSTSLRSRFCSLEGGSCRWVNSRELTATSSVSGSAVRATHTDRGCKGSESPLRGSRAARTLPARCKFAALGRRCWRGAGIHPRPAAVTLLLVPEQVQSRGPSPGFHANNGSSGRWWQRGLPWLGAGLRHGRWG